MESPLDRYHLYSVNRKTLHYIIAKIINYVILENSMVPAATMPKHGLRIVACGCLLERTEVIQDMAFVCEELGLAVNNH